MLGRIVIGIIKVYQRLSKLLMPKCCRFYPSCSEYTIQAVEKYGLCSGVWKGIKRISRCHPGNPGGRDEP